MVVCHPALQDRGVDDIRQCAQCQSLLQRYHQFPMTHAMCWDWCSIHKEKCIYCAEPKKSPFSYVANYTKPNIVYLSCIAGFYLPRAPPFYFKI